MQYVCMYIQSCPCAARRTDQHVPSRIAFPFWSDGSALLLMLLPRAFSELSHLKNRCFLRKKYWLPVVHFYVTSTPSYRFLARPAFATSCFACGIHGRGNKEGCTSRPTSLISLPTMLQYYPSMLVPLKPSDNRRFSQRPILKCESVCSIGQTCWRLRLPQGCRIQSHIKVCGGKKSRKL